MSDRTPPPPFDGEELTGAPGVPAPGQAPAAPGSPVDATPPAAAQPTGQDAPQPPAAGQPPLGYPAAQPPYGQAPYPQAGPQAPYGQAAYGPAGAPGPYGQAPQPPYGQAAPQPGYGHAAYGQAPAGQPPYGQAPSGQPPYGQAPYGQAPYGQGSPGQPPYGQPPAGATPYPQGFAAPPPAGPGGRGAGRGQRPGLVIGAGVAVTALAVAGIFAAGQLRGATPTPGGTTTAASEPAPASPGDAVRAYFDAIARGDSVTARGLLLDAPVDDRLLTDEAMRAAALAAPITDLTVTDPATPGGFSAEIDVAYSIGGRDVSKTMTVVKDGNLWRLATGTATARLATLRPDEIGLTINGVAVTSDNVDLFPGGYTLGTTNPTFALSPKSFVVEGPSTPPDLYSAKVSLSSAALKGVQSAAKAAFAKCLSARHNLVDAKCGVNFLKPPGERVAKNAVSCTVKSGRASVDKAKFKLDSTDFDVATARITTRLSCIVRASDGDRYIGYRSLFEAMATRSGDTWKVTFS